MLEHALWTKLKTSLADTSYFKLHRVENSLAAGLPDIIYSVRYPYGLSHKEYSYNGFIELKIVRKKIDLDLSISRLLSLGLLALSPLQVQWFLTTPFSHILGALLKNDRRLFLLSHERSKSKKPLQDFLLPANCCTNKKAFKNELVKYL